MTERRSLEPENRDDNDAQAPADEIFGLPLFISDERLANNPPGLLIIGQRSDWVVPIDPAHLTGQELAELWNSAGRTPRAKSIQAIVSKDYPETKNTEAFVSMACVEIELETPMQGEGQKFQYHCIPMGFKSYDEADIICYVVRALKS